MSRSKKALKAAVYACRKCATPATTTATAKSTKTQARYANQDFLVVAENASIHSLRNNTAVDATTPANKANDAIRGTVAPRNNAGAPQGAKPVVQMYSTIPNTAAHVAMLAQVAKAASKAIVVPKDGRGAQRVANASTSTTTPIIAGHAKNDVALAIPALRENAARPINSGVKREMAAQTSKKAANTAENAENNALQANLAATDTAALPTRNGAMANASMYKATQSTAENAEAPAPANNFVVKVYVPTSTQTTNTVAPAETHASLPKPAGQATANAMLQTRSSAGMLVSITRSTPAIAVPVMSYAMPEKSAQAGNAKTAVSQEKPCAETRAATPKTAKTSAAMTNAHPSNLIAITVEDAATNAHLDAFAAMDNASTSTTTKTIAANVAASATRTIFVQMGPAAQRAPLTASPETAVSTSSQIKPTAVSVDDNAHISKSAMPESAHALLDSFSAMDSVSTPKTIHSIVGHVAQPAVAARNV
jgi:hypothetical protein